MNWVFRKAMKPMITTQKRVQGPSLRITVHHHCGPLLAPGNTQSNRRIPISSLQESTTAYVSRDLLSHLPFFVPTCVLTSEAEESSRLLKPCHRNCVWSPPLEIGSPHVDPQCRFCVRQRYWRAAARVHPGSRE